MRKKAGEHLMLMQTQLFVRACVGPRSSSGDTDLQLRSHSLFMTCPHFSYFGTIEPFFGELWKNSLEASSASVTTLEWTETLRQEWREASTELGTFHGQDPSKPLGRAGCTLGKWWNSDHMTGLFFRSLLPSGVPTSKCDDYTIFAECLSGIKHGRCMYECLWQISPEFFSLHSSYFYK